MPFDQKDWERRLSQARAQEEFAELIMEIPEDSTPEDAAKSSATGLPRPTTPLFLNTRKGTIQVG